MRFFAKYPYIKNDAETALVLADAAEEEQQPESMRKLARDAGHTYENRARWALKSNPTLGRAFYWLAAIAFRRGGSHLRARLCESKSRPPEPTDWKVSS